MKSLVIKIPGFIFFTILFIPTFLYLYFPDLGMDFRLVAGVSLVVPIWQFSVSDYMHYVSSSNKFKWLTNGFIIVNGILYSFYLLTEEYQTIWLLLVVILFSLIITILMTIKIRSVFYARSWWFIVIETLVPPIGFLTLTPEIKAWESSEENIHNKNGSNSDQI